MKLLLTANGFYTEEIKKEFLQLIDDVPQDLNVAIISTASPLKEKNRFAQKAKKDFRVSGT